MLRREVEEMRQASETDLQPGTIEYETPSIYACAGRRTGAEKCETPLKWWKPTFMYFRAVADPGEIASILGRIPLSVQRRFPEMENRHVDFLKRDITKHEQSSRAG
nr:terminase small subunit [Escherichia coli]